MIKYFFSGIALATLLAGGALADNNTVFLSQDGDENAALIAQTGNGHIAGSTDQPITQNDDFNQIDVTQDNLSGRLDRRNTLGVGGNFSQRNLGVDQTGNRNALTVDQRLQSRIFMVQQDSSGAANTPAGPTNVATLTQTGNMRINQVMQTYTGDGTTGTENTLTIVQTGGQFQRSWIGDPDGLSNLNRGAFQTGASHDMTLTQTGPNNAIRRAAQFGTGQDMTVSQSGSRNLVRRAVQRGADNSLVLSFDGDNNGRRSLTEGAGAPGLGRATYVQRGSGNYAGLDVMGDNNGSAIFQWGDGNEIGSSMEMALSITGNGNQFAVSQTGADNDVAVSAFVGSRNVIGVQQTGDRNDLTLSVLGNRNGGFRSFTVGGDADIGLTPGFIDQNGNDNEIDLTVDGNGNVFTMLQDGNNNTITGLQDGNNNEAAISQVGAGHNTTFWQIGNNNVLGVTQ